MVTQAAEQSVEDMPGYKENALGYMVPISKVKQIDIDRDELVDAIFTDARQVRQAMSTFKNRTMDDIHAFVQLAAEEYGKNLGGKKGNTSLLSFDGKRKVQIQMSETIYFDERIKVAKALIDDCVTDWVAEGINDNLKLFIDDHFRTNSNGELRTAEVLKCFRYDITDAKWLKAMQALRDSIQVLGATSYIRFYQRRNANEKFQQVSLDLASM